MLELPNMQIEVKGMTEIMGSEVIAFSYERKRLPAMRKRKPGTYDVLVVDAKITPGLSKDGVRHTLKAGVGLRFRVSLVTVSVPKEGYELKMPFVDGSFHLRDYKVSKRGDKYRIKLRRKTLG